MKSNWKALIIALSATVICLGLIFAVQLLVNDWSFLAPATCWPECFYETVQDGFMRQPWNTISSLAFFTVGVYILCLPYQKAGKPILDARSSKLTRSILAIAAMITGLGSVFLHMSLSFIGQTFDVLGMYLISMFLILYAFRGNLSLKKFLLLYVLGGLLLLIILIFIPDLRRWLFALLMVVGLVIEYYRHRKNYQTKLLFASAGTLAFAFMFWILDSLRLLPHGHVLWHILGAAALGVLFAYYTKEKP